jgi:hypothetical protein
MGRGEVYIEFWWGDLLERDYLEDSSLDGSIILKWMFRKCHENAWCGLISLRVGTGTGHSNETSGSIKFGEFL